MKIDLEFGTWNTRTLLKPGALINLTNQLQKYNLMITAVQETKWTGVEIWDTKTHTIFSSGKNKSAKEGGVAFVVDRSI